MPVRLHTFARYYALAAAAFLLLFGFLGFYGPKTPIPYEFLIFTRSSGYLFGAFPVNLLTNVQYLIWAGLGFAAFAWVDFAGPRIYARGVAIWYGLLAVGGLIPVVNSVYGLMPFWGWGMAVHFSLAISAAFAGYWPFWVPNEAYDEGDADESGRPGVPKRRGIPNRPTGPAEPRPAAGRAAPGSPDYVPPKYDARGNPRA